LYKDLVKRHLENADEKLSASKSLKDNKFYRDSISRSYYAMFFAAKALLAVRQIYPKTHQGVIMKFSLEFVQRGFVDKIYGKSLSIAHEQRETADYDIDADFNKEDAEKNICRAAEFINAVKKAIKELEKGDISLAT
jgi:uncharacterized protein (UPF0332 family)